MNLKIDFCSYEAAKYAVMHWHYSRTMPAGKLFKLGVWENDKFIGSVIFGRGSNNNMSKMFNLKQTECVELVRVALTKHKTPVSRIISICLKILRDNNKGLKCVVSYADLTNQGHVGIIYQASNWYYLGERKTDSGHIILNGKIVHKRTISSKYGSHKNVPFKMINAKGQCKHLYAYALNQSMKEKLNLIKKEYPKRATKASAVSNSNAAVQSRPARSKIKKVM